MSRLPIHPDLHTKFKSRGAEGAAAFKFYLLHPPLCQL